MQVSGTVWYCQSGLILVKMKLIKCLVAWLFLASAQADTTITVHVTSTLIPFTTTVNPADPTSWFTAEPKYIWPGTVTTPLPNSCINYQGPIYLPSGPPERTFTNSITHIERASTTITDATYPTYTHYSVTTPTVTYGANRTVTSYKCTNTVVRLTSFIETSTVTTSWAPAVTTINTSGLCFITQYQYVPIPQTSLFEKPHTVAQPDPRQLLTGNTTLVTSTAYQTSWSTTTITLETLTRVSQRCNNPTSTETSTRTESRTVTTATVDCLKPTSTSRINYSMPQRGEVTRIATTELYTTAGVINGTRTTLTGTMNVDRWAYINTETVYVWVTADITVTAVTGTACATTTR